MPSIWSAVAVAIDCQNLYKVTAKQYFLFPFVCFLCNWDVAVITLGCSLPEAVSAASTLVFATHAGTQPITSSNAAPILSVALAASKKLASTVSTVITRSGRRLQQAATSPTAAQTLATTSQVTSDVLAAASIGQLVNEPATCVSSSGLVAQTAQLTPDQAQSTLFDLSSGCSATSSGSAASASTAGRRLLSGEAAAQVCWRLHSCRPAL